jgi:ActR/RegA family two-component response regulator
VEPDHLEDELTANEKRNVLVLADGSCEDNEFFRRITRNGYMTRAAHDLTEALEILSEGTIRVLALDARNLGNLGLVYVRRVNHHHPEIKVIVFNESNTVAEKQFRKYNIFYYGVNPITNNEMVDLLHCAFTSDQQKITLYNPHASRFLPNIISRISLTNRKGLNILLFAYHDVLQQNIGLGYLLTEDLRNKFFPLTIYHSRTSKSMDDLNEIQQIALAKERYDKIIVLASKEMNSIPGSITKKIKEFKNKASSHHTLININIQPACTGSGKFAYGAETTVALKDQIMKELV